MRKLVQCQFFAIGIFSFLKHWLRRDNPVRADQSEFYALPVPTKQDFCQLLIIIRSEIIIKPKANNLCYLMI